MKKKTDEKGIFPASGKGARECDYTKMKVLRYLWRLLGTSLSGDVTEWRSKIQEIP